MTYGDLPLDAPEKPNKGQEGGACNRRACQAEPALWWNHGSSSWYCEDCARDIGEDPVNKRHWDAQWRPRLDHPMFETREMIDAREAACKPMDDHIAETAEMIHAKLERRYFPLGHRGAPPIRNRDKPAVSYNHPPESRQVRRARERAEAKRDVTVAFRSRA